MAVELITGVPGSGKTCYSMQRMLDAVEQGRPLYVHGIRGLTIPHISVHCDHPLCVYCKEEKPKDGEVFMADHWHLWAPVGAYIVLDEVQRCYRVRPPSAPVPDSVQEFEIHRHRGLDFVLMTQHPNLIDVNVRRQVGKHIHLIANWAGRKQWEYPEYSDSPSRGGEGAVKSRYSLKKEHFALYKSAELHTKIPRKKPLALWFLLVAFAAFGYLAYQSFGRVQARASGELLVEEGGEAMPAPAGTPASPLPGSQSGVPEYQPAGLSGFMPGWDRRMVGYSVIGGKSSALFEFSRAGFQSQTFSSVDLQAMGVVVSLIGRCRARLVYMGESQLFSCAPPATAPETQTQPGSGFVSAFDQFNS